MKRALGVRALLSIFAVGGMNASCSCGGSDMTDAAVVPADTGVRTDAMVIADTGVRADGGALDVGTAMDATPVVDAQPVMDAAPVMDATAVDATPDMDAEAADVANADAGVDAGFDSGVGDGAVPVVCAPPVTGGSAFSGRIFGAYSYSGPSLPIFEVTTGTAAAPATFATVNAGGWIGPLAITRAGQFLAVTNANNGSIFDISAGGDLTAATPLASGLFAAVSFPEGLAIDAAGDMFVTNSEAGAQPIAKATQTGSVSHLPHDYDNATSLAICGGTLVIAEGGTGTIIAHDIATDSEAIFATGFQAGQTHISSQMIVDMRGHLLVLWRVTGGTTGLFDVTAGGDFSAATPLVPATFSIDVNQLAVDAQNNIYAAGDGGGSMYRAHFNGTGFDPFTVWATGLGDTESAVVGP